MASPQFNSLKIREVSPQTSDAISVAFEVPDNLRDSYTFTQGQFLTLRADVNGEELRRSYSVCVGVNSYLQNGELRVAIKRVADGRFSNWANDHLAVGQSIDVMTPDGRFNTPLSASNDKHYVGFAGGSGITPMVSLIATTLETEPDSSFTLIYGNRMVNTIMFVESLEGLKNRFMGRFRLVHVLSDEAQDIELFNGVLDQSKCREIINALLPVDGIDQAYICGPEVMMNAAEQALLEAGVDAKKIAVERFGTPNPSGAPKPVTSIDDTAPGSIVTILIDGKQRDIKVPFEGASILDAGLLKGAHLPYACKGGVCCTCRAKVISGEVKMDKCFTLEKWEIDQGFVLTCQSHPVSEKVVISYDER